MHARGMEQGGRFRWLKYYDAPELMALIDTEPRPITWEELEP